MSKKILVTVEKDGATKIEAQGFTNNSCLKETESLEQALGIVSKRTKKSEAMIPDIGIKAPTVKVGG